MSTHRILSRRQLKPECIAEYCRLHDNFSQEMAHAYQQAGFVRMSSFLCGNDLIFCGEVDTEAYARGHAMLDQNPLEQRWQELMQTLNAPGTVSQEYTEVFRWPR
jgi:L-rhamnose mutarotase